MHNYNIHFEKVNGSSNLLVPLVGTQMYYYSSKEGTIFLIQKDGGCKHHPSSRHLPVNLSLSPTSLRIFAGMQSVARPINPHRHAPPPSRPRRPLYR